MRDIQLRGLLSLFAGCSQHSPGLWKLPQSLHGFLFEFWRLGLPLLFGAAFSFSSFFTGVGLLSLLESFASASRIASFCLNNAAIWSSFAESCCWNFVFMFTIVSLVVDICCKYFRLSALILFEFV